MIHPDMTAAEYHALPAVSASMLIDARRKCPAYAWAYSSMNEKQLPEKKKREFDHGIAVHLAALEPHLLEERTVTIDAHDYKTKAAQEARDAAYAAGKVPLLWKNKVLVGAMYGALQRSEAAPLLFGEGQSEVSYTWEIIDDSKGPLGFTKTKPGEATIEWPRISCKARVDRLQGATLIDLKTAESASPEAFDSAVLAYGYHQRAAWYLDGFRGHLYEDKPRYLYVLVENEPPHLVGIYACSERAEEWGRRINKAMLAEISHGLETGNWRGYQGGARELRQWVEYQYAEQEEEGRL